MTTAAGSSKPQRTFFHLQLQDAYAGDYWLHLEMAGSARLSVLDDYLRSIWLECCGHLSQLETGPRPWRGTEIPFSAKAGQILRPGVELTHIYDFGSSSYTNIKVLGERRGFSTIRHPIALMARNDAPAFPCRACDRIASRLCLTCIYDAELDGALCEDHSAEHVHDDAEVIPMLNSPRLGTCGYEGPAKPPY